MSSQSTQKKVESHREVVEDSSRMQWSFGGGGGGEGQNVTYPVAQCMLRTYLEITS
jgi:hypothetical protein